MGAIIHNDGRVEIIRDVVGPGDPRLADARDPNPHASTHADGGSDPIITALDPRAYPVLTDTLANRPVFGVVGRLFYATDTDELYLDLGAAWALVADDPSVLAAHASTHVDGGTDAITSKLDPRATAILVDDLANRPAATIANSGRFFYALDTDTLFVNDPGGTWLEVAAPYLHGASHIDGGADEITSPLDPRAYPCMQGDVASRPAATIANAGRLYWADDEHVLYINDGGGTWRKAAVADYSDLDSRSVQNADVSAIAAIDYSKLNLVDGITNSDIFSLAAIAYSKLNLAGSIKDSDFSTVLADRPVGDVLTHNEVTSNTTISATTEATANNIVAASAFTFDGSTAVMIEAYFPDASAIGAWTCNFVLWDNTAGASVGLLGGVTLAAGASSGPLYLRRRLTPANGSRTYSIRAFRGTANGTVNAGAGGAGARVPGFVRITKA